MKLDEQMILSFVGSIILSLIGMLLAMAGVGSNFFLFAPMVLGLYAMICLLILILKDIFR